jgi:hypothetical protein
MASVMAASVMAASVMATALIVDGDHFHYFLN